MSGKPAARQGDMTQYGGPIVQGSAGVRIGAPTGVACSVCPGGMTSGNPVNPLLGAKVLPGETDLALPGPLPFILSRTYSSYRTRTPAPVGVFGPGWKAPSDIRLQLRDDALVLNDNGGRSIHFEPLLPGEAVYSRSESMWLVRGGKAAQPDGHTLAWLWGALPPDIRLSPHLYLATNSAQGPWWILGWSERVPGAEDVLPAPLPPYRVLTGLADRFGRTLTYRREAAGDLAGEITGVTDGAGREFRLVLTTQAQRAEEARTSSLSSSDSSRPLSASPFPDTLPGNRIAEDAHYVYRYDEYGRLAEKTDRIPEGVIRMHDERTHHYHYDSQHRLVFYTRIQHGEPQVESRYLYDPLGRRTGKRVWRRERDLTGWMSLSRKPEETWYGWDGDRLTTVQTQQTRIQTVYQPGSFTPLLRIETENGEQAKARHRSLAEVLQEDTGVTLPAELAVMLGRLERELRQGSVSEESQQWLAQCGLTAEQMAAQLEAEYIPERKLHLYHCDHRGLPLALISPEGETAWQGEYDEWGNLLGEESAQHLQQSLRLPGQQYDEESGLYYNRNRYYDPLQGRYITQDPIGLRGEWNLYKYPLNPVRFIDSLGLKFHVNGDPSDFNQAVEYLKQDSQMKETIDFLS
ncbi:TPA: RHS repeat-associated core domain-containing protein, partial [Escherichia coli]